MSVLIRSELLDGRSLVIRPARREDACSMVQKVEQVAREGDFLASESAPFTVEALDDLLQDHKQQTFIMVAELNGLVVGDLWLSRGRLRKNAHTATIGMSIIQPYRGQGIGRQLLRAAVTVAYDLEIEKLALSVFSSNHRAVALYSSEGFTEEGRRLRQYRLAGGDVDEIFMAKWLR